MAKTISISEKADAGAAVRALMSDATYVKKMRDLTNMSRTITQSHAFSPLDERDLVALNSVEFLGHMKGLESRPYFPTVRAIAAHIKHVLVPAGTELWVYAELWRLLWLWEDHANFLLDFCQSKQSLDIRYFPMWLRPINSKVVTLKRNVPSVFHQRGNVFIKGYNFNMSHDEAVIGGLWYEPLDKNHPAWSLAKSIDKYNLDSGASPQSLSWPVRKSDG